MLKNLFSILVFFTTILLLSNTLHAEENDEEVQERLETIETEREERMEEMLLLSIPEISDNPNHIITFQDPSGEGVFLEIDGGDFEEIESPYTLPSLSLGRHFLTFKFTDEQGTEHMLERRFTVIPRPPTINPPTIVENEINIGGTATANSEVEIFLSREMYNEKAIAEVNSEGEWEHKFTENIEEGLYTIISITRRNGYSSKYSEPIVFTVGEDKQTIVPVQGGNEISFSFANLDFENYRNTLAMLRNNTDLLIAFGVFFILGAIFAWIIISILYKISQRKSKKVLQELLRKKDKQAEEIVSLKDKFEKTKEEPKEDPPEDEEVEEEKEEEEKEEEEKAEKKEKPKKKVKEKEEKKEDKVEEENKDEEENEDESVDEEEEVEEEKDEAEEEARKLTKEEFMKKFSEFDPDDDEGKEKKMSKKKLKISLTSKD